MTPDRLKQIADAYGSDWRRWPAAEQAEARALTTSGLDGERLLLEARQTDAVLDASPRPQVSTALRDRVIASALAAGLSPRTARRVWDRLVLWFGAGWAVAACAGVIAGANLTQHVTANQQADAVLYQSSLSGVDDAEVLG